MTPAVFLDRDGVLIDDLDLICRIDQVQLLRGVGQALEKLKAGGFKLLVITNQPVIARGMATDDGVRAIHAHIQELLVQDGGPPLDGWFVCPHHPNATLPAYRVICECRKPQPGLLLQAAREHSVDLSGSFMIGDRITDIIAGAKAGVRTILVLSGKHLAQPIQTAEPLDTTVKPDHICADLSAAAAWILKQTIP